MSARRVRVTKQLTSFMDSQDFRGFVEHLTINKATVEGRSQDLCFQSLS